MTSATQALIEEARLEAEKRYDYFTPTAVDIAAVADEKSAAFIRGAEWAASRLADALEASEAARRDLTDKIEARIEHWRVVFLEEKARNTALVVIDELRGLVSGDKEQR